MNFTHKDSSTTFSVPDSVNVRQQLEYFAASVSPGASLFERYWLGAKTLITDWQSDILPDYAADLESVSDPRVTGLIIWAGMEVKKHLDRLGEVPKN